MAWNVLWIYTIYMAKISLKAVLFVVLGLAAIYFIFTYMASGKGCKISTESRTVSGNSLSGIIESGDRVKIKIGYYACNEVERGDLVVYDHPSTEAPLIKIVQAIPGDRWRLEKTSSGGSWLIVNDVVIQTPSGEPYEFSGAQEKMLNLYVGDYKGVIPDEAYLILGTEPGGSYDSSRFGLVGKGQLTAKALK